jgi:hypothetical protein
MCCTAIEPEPPVKICITKPSDDNVPNVTAAMRSSAAIAFQAKIVARAGQSARDPHGERNGCHADDDVAPAGGVGGRPPEPARSRKKQEEGAEHAHGIEPDQQLRRNGQQDRPHACRQDGGRDDNDRRQGDHRADQRKGLHDLRLIGARRIERQLQASPKTAHRDKPDTDWREIAKCRLTSHVLFHNRYVIE